MTDVLQVERTGDVLKLTLNRPEQRNALSLALLRALKDALVDDTPRVVVIAGNGPVFCGGLDLKEMADGEKVVEATSLLADVFTRLATGPFLTVCAAQSRAVGGGAGFVLSCDLAVVDDGFELSFPELRRGIVPALVTVLLARRVNDGVSRSMLLTGRPASAQDLQRLGVVHEVAGSSPSESANRLAQSLLRQAPLATAATKRLLAEQEAIPLRDALHRAMNHHRDAAATAEAAEGTAAWREKREPAWARRDQ